jgi:hypothetical protein
MTHDFCIHIVQSVDGAEPEVRFHTHVECADVTVAMRAAVAQAAMVGVKLEGVVAVSAEVTVTFTPELLEQYQRDMLRATPHPASTQTH